MQIAFIPQLQVTSACSFLIFAFLAILESASSDHHSYLSSDKAELDFDRDLIDTFASLGEKYCVLCIKVMACQIVNMIQFFLSLQLTIQRLFT